MNEDPWKGLEPPSGVGTISARRADPDLPWGFFWARGTDRSYMLVLVYSLEASRVRHLPVLRGIEVLDTEGEQEGFRMLAFKLLLPEHRDLFQRLCRDVIESTRGASSELEAVETTLARTWRWHHLLRGGDDGRLSAEEQKGLIGELMVLRDLLLLRLSAMDAVAAWQGPLGFPKDFVIGRICIEAKARRGAAKPYVAISNPEQLDTEGTDALYLCVVEIDRAPPDAGNGVSVTDVATDVRQRLEHADPATLEQFEGLLSAAGLRWDDDYSDVRWIEGSRRMFTVADGFPRITPSTLGAGVTDVRYSVSLVECSEYECDDSAVLAMIERSGNAS